MITKVRIPYGQKTQKESHVTMYLSRMDKTPIEKLRFLVLCIWSFNGSSKPNAICGAGMNGTRSNRSFQMKRHTHAHWTSHRVLKMRRLIICDMKRCEVP